MNPNGVDSLDEQPEEKSSFVSKLGPPVARNWAQAAALEDFSAAKFGPSASP